LAIYHEGTIIHQNRGALGQHAEVYDAEMEGLATAAEAVADILERPRPLPIKQIYYFTDNTGAIQRIFKGTPGKAQSSSIRFHRAMLRTLDANPALSIAVEWTPGHQGIDGNEMADSLAKEGSISEPPDPGWQSISFIGASNRRLLRENWINVWGAATRHPRSDFSLADRFIPQLRPTARFIELSRSLFSRVTQARTGHAHIGAYYRNFVPTEDPECPCGEGIQTRHHILTNCTLYTDQRALLGATREEASIAALVGTADGVIRLADFIKETGAFAKSPADENPSL
jgi:ribonuclease HI